MVSDLEIGHKSGKVNKQVDIRRLSKLPTDVVEKLHKNQFNYTP